MIDTAATGPKGARGECLVDVKQLEVVRAICQEGSFGGAARRLGLTQPTLSKIIAKLETTLGIQLFDRSGYGATPTSYGEFLAERAGDVLTAMSSISRELTDWVTGDAGRLRIGIGPATRIKPLPGLLDALHAHYPHLSVQVRQIAGPGLVKAVSDGRFDCVFSFAGNAFGNEDLIRLQIFEDDIVVAARPNHQIFEMPTVTADDLLRFRVASMGVVTSLREWVGPLTIEQQRNIEAFVCDDSMLMKRRLFDSDYVGHGPAFLFAEEVADGRLRTRSIEWPQRFECWMLTTRAHWQSPLMKNIAQLARASASA